MSLRCATRGWHHGVAAGAALKCGGRARWIGRDVRVPEGRLTVLATTRRLLMRPAWHRPTLGSRVLSLTARRIGADWPACFGHPVLLLETVVDPRRFPWRRVSPPTGSSWD